MAETMRILHIVGAMYPGGIENYIMNLYQNIDRSRLQFDIAVHTRKENDYVPLIESMGGKVYELPRLTVNPIGSLRKLYHIVKDNQYKVVIRHTSNALITPQLIVARLAGAKTICHSHSETDPQILLHKLGRLFMNVAATDKFACSEKAGKWMFGKADYQIIHNAIDIHKFVYQKEKEEKIREEFRLGKGKVYGHIANFIECKNHMYLLSVYKEISKIDPEAVFFCIGEGAMRERIEAEIKRLNLEEKVILTGIRKDVDNFMSCFDVLLFPSIFEGLPLTLIEAQAAGLPALISDTITKDVIVTENIVTMESIETTPDVWARRAVEIANLEARNKSSRICQYDSIARAGYDIKALAKWFENYICDDNKITGTK